MMLKVLVRDVLFVFFHIQRHSTLKYPKFVNLVCDNYEWYWRCLSDVTEILDYKFKKRKFSHLYYNFRYLIKS